MKKALSIIISIVMIIAALPVSSAFAADPIGVTRTEFNNWYENEAKTVKADHYIGPDGDLNTGSYCSLVLPGETIGIIPQDANIAGGAITNFNVTVAQLNDPEVVTESYGRSYLPRTGTPSKTTLTEVEKKTMPIPYGARGEDYPDDAVNGFSGISSFEYVSLYRNDTGLPIVIFRDYSTKNTTISDITGYKDSYTKFQGWIRIEYAPKFQFLENYYEISYKPRNDEYSWDELVFNGDYTQLPDKIYVDGKNHTYIFPKPILKGHTFFNFTYENSDYLWLFRLAARNSTSVSDTGYMSTWYDDRIELVANAQEYFETITSAWGKDIILSPDYSQSNSYCCTVEFFGNGGTVNGKSSYLCETLNPKGAYFLDLATVVPKRNGYAFKGWCTNLNDPEGTLITDTSVGNYNSWRNVPHTDLYAVWSDPIKLDGAVITGIANKTYTGKAITQEPVVKLDGKTLTKGTDYTLSYLNNINAGTATVTVTGAGAYIGTIKKNFTIAKAANTLTVKAKKPTVKYNSLKKKNQNIAVKSWATVTKAQGKVTYKKASGNKKITVSKAGKITVKKGLRKGTYKVKIKVTAAGNANYKAGSKTVTVKIKVK